MDEWKFRAWIWQAIVRWTQFCWRILYARELMAKAAFSWREAWADALGADADLDTSPDSASDDALYYMEQDS